MSEFLLFTIIIISVASALVVVNNLMLKRTYLAVVGRILIAITGTLTILSFYIAKNGLIHLTWAFPLGIFLVMGSLRWIIIEIKGPFRAITNFIVDLTNGELDKEIPSSYLNRRDDIGRTFRRFEKYQQKLK